jgi:hypothetical protein
VDEAWPPTRSSHNAKQIVSTCPVPASHAWRFGVVDDTVSREQIAALLQHRREHDQGEMRARERSARCHGPVSRRVAEPRLDLSRRAI